MCRGVSSSYDEHAAVIGHVVKGLSLLYQVYSTPVHSSALVRQAVTKLCGRSRLRLTVLHSPTIVCSVVVKRLRVWANKGSRQFAVDFSAPQMVGMAPSSCLSAADFGATFPKKKQYSPWNQPN